MKKNILLILMLLFFCATANAQSGVVIDGPAAQPISIGITPPGATIGPGVSQQFVATVASDFLNSGVVWTLTCPGGVGAICGTLSPSFKISGSTQTISLSATAITYTAPATAPNPPTATLTATSIQDSSKFTSVVLNISGTGSSPASPVNVSALTSQTATAANTFNLGSTAGNDALVGVVTDTTDVVSSVQICNPQGRQTGTGFSQTCQNMILTDQATNTTAGINLFVYELLGISAGQGSVIVNNSTAHGSVAIAYSDVQNAGVEDLSAHLNNQFGSNPSGPSVTTTAANDFVASFVATSGTITSAASPFTLATGSAGFGFGEAFQTVAAVGPVSPSYFASSGSWASVTVALKSTASNPNAPISVALAPTNPTVQVNGTQNFICSVSNDSANGGCNITYTGTGCTGSTCGTGPSTAASGVPFTYTAPASVPGSGGSAITRIQKGSGNFGGACQGLATCSIPITASQGGATDLICAIGVSVTASTLTVTDNLSQTYSPIFNTGNGVGMACNYGGAAGVTSLKFTFSVIPHNGVADMHFVEYTGITSGTPDQKVGPNTVSTSTSGTSGFFASPTTHANDVLIGISMDGAATSFTAADNGRGGNYTLLSQQLDQGSAVEDFFPTTATNTYEANWTIAPASTSTSYAVAFPGGAGGGSATPVQVTGTSVTDATKSATATVTIQTAAAPLSVTVAPTAVSVQVGGTTSFTGTIANGSGNLNWTITQNGVACGNNACGTISTATTASGVALTYTAPSAVPAIPTVTITAASSTNPTTTAAATITVTSSVGPKTCSGSPCAAFFGTLGNAEGGGAASVGGRGGVVYNINDLTDSLHSGCVPGNPSTTCGIRDCIQATGARNCIFRVSGSITNNTRLQISNPFITIEGQSAPGGPITFHSALTSTCAGADCATLFISTHDVVVRYVTYDGLSLGQVGHDVGTVGFEFASGEVYNVVLDHVTTRWWGNKTWVVVNNQVPGVHDITTQWSLAYEPNIGHPVILEPDTTDGSSLQAVNIDYHHDMGVNYQHRWPLSNVRSMHWVNNISYNCCSQSQDFTWMAWGAIQADIIGNKVVDGPQIVANVHNYLFQFQQCQNDQADNCSTNTPAQYRGDNSGTPSVYMINNIGHICSASLTMSCQNGTLNAATHVANDSTQVSQTFQGWEGGESLPGNNIIAPVPAGAFRSTPLPAENFPITATAAENLDAVLISTVGNSQALNCDGTVHLNRDSQDARIIAQYQAGGPGGPIGITNNPSDPEYSPLYNGPTVNNGAFPSPTIAPGTACTESLGDGIPDAWKQKNGLSTTDTGLGTRIDTTTGLTYFEDYYDGLTPKGGAAATFQENFSEGSLNTSAWQINNQTFNNYVGAGSNYTSTSANCDFSTGMLRITLQQPSASVSTGCQIQSKQAFGYGTYLWSIRASTTSATPSGTGTTQSGQISTGFIISDATSKTEIDSPEIEGQFPTHVEFTNWLNQANGGALIYTAPFNPQDGFHTYSFKWNSTSVTYFVDGVQVGQHTTFIPSASNPGFVIIDHYGTNSSGFGGVATPGVTRYLYCNLFQYFAGPA